MTTATKFPLTNLELADMGGLAGPVYFPASFEEYWEVLAEAEYRTDYYDHQIIATMSYESDLHSLFATKLTTIFGNIFAGKPEFRVYNSNRPVYIADCTGTGTGVFNADGMVVALPSQKFEYSPGMSAETTPVVLVEVLSKSTRDYDFGTKLPCYKKIESLQQILFVEQNKPGVLAMERQGPNRWTETELSAPDETFSVGGRPVTLREIYTDVYGGDQ